MMRPQPSAPLTAVRRPARWAALLGGALLLTVGLAGPVQAQSTPSGSAARSASDGAEATETTRERWKSHFGEQIAHALRDSSSGRMRATLLRTLIDVAIEEGSAMDFSAAVSALLRVVEHDPVPRRRLLALQALSLVGPERADEARYRSVMARLRTRLPDDPSPPVRRAVASMLSDDRPEAPAS